MQIFTNRKKDRKIYSERHWGEDTYKDEYWERERQRRTDPEKEACKYRQCNLMVSVF
jgi:hypothetical protein